LPYSCRLQKNRPPSKQAQGGRQGSGGCEEKGDGDKKPANQTTASSVFRQQFRAAFSAGATCPRVLLWFAIQFARTSCYGLAGNPRQYWLEAKL